MLLLTGYHKLPREQLYWSLDEDSGIPFVTKAISRNRFRDKKYLHWRIIVIYQKMTKWQKQSR
ncbi:hypothetical protein NQ315_011639 [Exocentrus adspersus]|uniref:PiggyBac transposable element-derived protein domain-containing protein n=1 Tax=Exocentrus adspersus TaxID=1586481 RepID=A0AAV8V9I4_9CUCU|nr:hypothetical protein NQ315_011639 [Exocentrus adspersus]